VSQTWGSPFRLRTRLPAGPAGRKAGLRAGLHAPQLGNPSEGDRPRAFPTKRPDEGDKFFRSFRVVLGVGLQAFQGDRRLKDNARRKPYLIPSRLISFRALWHLDYQSSSARHGRTDVAAVEVFAAAPPLLALKRRYANALLRGGSVHVQEPATSSRCCEKFLKRRRSPKGIVGEDAEKLLRLRPETRRGETAGILLSLLCEDDPPGCHQPGSFSH
jgi:hypothetical protein